MKKDVIIIGGGMVGAATALGLAKLGLNIALIEKNHYPSFNRILLMTYVFLQLALLP